MTEAEKAFRAAKREIARFGTAGGDRLNLSMPRFHALAAVPAEISGLTGITWLDRAGTAVSDLSPLAGMTDTAMARLRRGTGDCGA